jgi:hypothetical protein
MDAVFLGQLIVGLDEGRFADLCNELLSAAAAGAAIPRSCVRTTMNTKEGDEGVDARCLAAPATAGALIPRANVAYQFKAGPKKKSAAKIVEEDIVGKAGVRKALLAGHAFVYISAADRSPEFEREIVEAALEQDPALIAKGQIVFIGRDTLARTLHAYPGLIAEFLRLDEKLFSLRAWSQFESLDNPFQADAEVEARLTALRVRVADPAARVRVVGSSGNGKTRTVLEALRGSNLAPIVLYAKQAEDLTGGFVSFLRNTPDVECIVVVDEVDEAAAADLRDRFSGMPPGVRLITIGLDASGRAPAQTLQVKGLSQEMLIAIVSSIAPGLTEGVPRAIAEACAESPKLAVVVARQIKMDPSLAAPHRMLTDPTIRGVLDQYLRFDERDPRWSALSAVALLERVGWTGEVENESEVLFRAVGLDPTTARTHVGRLHERHGIAPLAGRFRYISPAILADHLAARQLDSWTQTRLRQVLTQLTPAMADGFAKRMRRLAAALENRTAVEEVILGDQGPFRTLADLEDGRLSRLLNHLAGAFPAATLRALRRIIEPASDDELRAATTSRRDVVWAVEQLLWRQDTFEAAAALLLRLATTENETWGNNATGLWAETFQTILGRTEAGAGTRVRVLEQAASGTAPQARLLAAKALGGAFRIEGISRSGMPPDDVEGMPQEAWRPKTYGEWWELLRTYLALLTPLLTDEDAEVRAEAAKALTDGIDSAVKFPVTEAWIAAARGVRGADYTLRALIIEALDDHLDQHPLRGEAAANQEGEDAQTGEQAPAEVLAETSRRVAQLAALRDELMGEDFSSRMRYAVNRTAWAEARDDTHTRRSEAAALAMRNRLAGEVVRQPVLLDGEWEWLLAQPAPAPERWVELLGQVDRRRVLIPVLERLAAQHPRAATWVSLYDVAYAKVKRDDSFIDRRAEELLAAGAGPARVFDLLYHAGYAPTRLRQVLDLLESHAVPGESIKSLIWAPWMSRLTTPDAVRLAQAAAQDQAATASVIAFINHFIRTNKDARGAFRDIAVPLLRAPASRTEAGLDEHEWTWLALEYVAEAPGEIAAAALQRIAQRGSRHGSDLKEVLRRAWQAGDKERLFVDAFEPWLEAETSDAWRVREALEHLSLGELGADQLARWVAGNPEQRARPLAETLGAPVGRPSDVHAMLLERYGAEEVGGVLFGAYISGAHWGPQSAWLRQKLADAQEWVNDERPAVQQWARGVVKSLEAMIQDAENREAEDRFR